jgi:hypothetical protein
MKVWGSMMVVLPWLGFGGFEIGWRWFWMKRNAENGEDGEGRRGERLGFAVKLKLGKWKVEMGSKIVEGLKVLRSERRGRALGWGWAFLTLSLGMSFSDSLTFDF